jgi:hypothetical protein
MVIPPSCGTIEPIPVWSRSMRNRLAACCLLPAVLLGVIAFSRITPVQGAANATSAAWNKQAAAHYLDQRETWWQSWPRAQKDHGTVCVSCHTVVPYALVRPDLRRDLGGSAMTAPEQTMLASVDKRVSGWSAMVPFYSDEKSGPGKTAESHSTEAVLNAVILASYDAARNQIRPTTRAAFDEAWALQQSTGPLSGAWIWQDFHLSPWESSESPYQGAALFLLEADKLPGRFVRKANTRAHLDRLRGYLRSNYAAQPLVNQLYILWASANDASLLTPSEHNALNAALRSRQQPDGGFRIASLDPRKRIDGSSQSTVSDGYATGLAVLALEATRTPSEDPMLRRSLAWLTQHQQSNGSWIAASLNKQRDPASDPALFMTDAATAYAVLALERQPERR